jgi:hypothetical protein
MLHGVFMNTQSTSYVKYKFPKFLFYLRELHIGLWFCILPYLDIGYARKMSQLLCCSVYKNVV